MQAASCSSCRGQARPVCGRPAIVGNESMGEHLLQIATLASVGMQRQSRSGSICTVGTGCCFGYQCEKGAYGGGDAVLTSNKDGAAGLERLKGLTDQIRELAG
jgi:hypothetical protein